MPYSKHLPRIFTDEEISLVVESILNSKVYHFCPAGEFLKWRDVTAIELMYYSGLRPAECLQLKWTDLDFDKRLIYVRPYFNKRKNDLPAIMTIPAKKILTKFREKVNNLNVKCEWIFPSFWTWLPITVGAMNRIFLNVCKELGLALFEYQDKRGIPKYSTNLYCLRHSFCTKIYKKTRSEIAVSRLARHTQVQSASIYTHLNFEEKQEIADSVFE